ncbi:DNA helicase IV [Lentzea xinjiangensis]|uniref:DNA helicase IV n=1 Tax=Lentzea xinjiangensis TaxID=402600 RepID=A0A1H9I6P5_9PSEU|nr:DNA helicase IV [Lentzea xinjiangensis]
MLGSEQARITSLYERLDQERNKAAVDLAAALRDTTTRRLDREAAVEVLARQVVKYRAAEEGLCFGRIDSEKGDCTYIGRVGLFDDNFEPLLLDWRAPAARPFYTATPANPEGVVLRRHFRVRGRELRDFHDDELLTDATALLEALNAPRTATMRDIVSTIQAEQDDIIRYSGPGVLVIEGGPGTGKTAVALHRVAYLLYTRRERLSRHGVLIVGPNTGFLRYVGDVLPSLGETDVVFVTPGELYPGVSTDREDTPSLQRLKGDLSVLDLLAIAVADRQELPDEPIEIELEDVVVPLDAHIAAVAREKTRYYDLPHNAARKYFFLALAEELVAPAMRLIGVDWPEIEEDVRHELRHSSELRDAVDRLWPQLTPEQLLADLYAGRCFRIGVPELYREDADAWTVSDVPLLDELADLLGSDGSAEREARREEEAQLDYARGVMDVLSIDKRADSDEYIVTDFVNAEMLAARHDVRDHRSLAERAAADRTWTYGHVVVDEAQELSAMDWRVLLRRCPNRSMTVVGDLAQRQAAGGVRSWGSVFDRFTYRRLEVNYRTPGEIMAVAAPVLKLVDLDASAPVSVRKTGVRPWSRRVSDLSAAVRDELDAHEAARNGRTIAVIGDGWMPPRASKGLEFDVVLVVEPQRMSPSELYVALTRATQQLGVLHTEPLPRHLRSLL